VKDQTTFSIPGTGLGLAICLNLAQLLKAQLKLEYSNEQGTCFSFTLPVCFK
jgi:signal transduction histidine kinase